MGGTMSKEMTFFVGVVLVLGLASFIGLMLNEAVSSSGKEPIRTTQLSNISPSPTQIADVPDIPLRPQYEGLPSETFSKLPPWQFDFEAVKLDFELSRISLQKIDERYFLQPEFYPNFGTSAIDLMKNYPKDAEAKYGIGTYPSEYVAIAQNDEIMEVQFLIYSSWGVVSYTGLSLKPKYVETAILDRSSFPDGSRSVSQNISYAAQHIKIISISPDEFVLEPSYSKWNLKYDKEDRLLPELATPHFEKAWARKITVKFQTKGLEKGKYHIGIDIFAPSTTKSEAWAWQYRGLYQVAGAYSIGKPMFNLFIVKS